jgi:hypothetical protein
MNGVEIIYRFFIVIDLTIVTCFELDESPLIIAPTPQPKLHQFLQKVEKI